MPKSEMTLISSSSGNYIVIRNPKPLPRFADRYEEGHKMTKKELIDLATWCLQAAAR